MSMQESSQVGEVPANGGQGAQRAHIEQQREAPEEAALLHGGLRKGPLSEQKAFRLSAASGNTILPRNNEQARWLLQEGWDQRDSPLRRAVTATDAASATAKQNAVRREMNEPGERLVEWQAKRLTCPPTRTPSRGGRGAHSAGCRARDREYHVDGAAAADCETEQRVGTTSGNLQG